MNTFVKVTFAVGVPMMVLLGMSDLAATFYRPDPAEQLGYQVVEPEEIEEEVVEEAAAEEAPVEEEPAAEEVAEAATEEEAEGVEAPVEEAPTEEVASTDTSTEETTSEETVVDDATTEEAPVEETVEVAEESATQEDATTQEAAPVMVALTDDELKQAERSMRKCKTCHQVDRERNAAGPHLVGVIGRQIASVDGFRYSDALTALGDAGEVWNVENLQAWIENPNAFADGSRMNFKIGDEEERRLIAGWLAAQ